MNKPLVSIIIPVYNVEKYLKKCVDSILSQSFTKFELILVDDGSTDNSPQICDEYTSKDNRVHVLHKKNGGVSAARNDGLDVAQGEYVSFIDSDDWVEEDYLQTLLNYNEFDIVFFSHRLIYEDGYSSKFLFQEKEADTRNIWNVITFLKKNSTEWNFYGYTWNKIFRRAIIEKYKVRFVEGLRVSEDEVFTLDYCTHACSIKVLPICLYNYRVLRTGLTAVKNAAVEYEKLADSYIAILFREANENIDNLYTSDIITYLYMGAMGYKNPYFVYKVLKKLKSLLPKSSHVKCQSSKMRLFVSLPIYIELVWWYFCRIKINVVNLIK